jgi:hypothetical protein
MLSTGTTLLFTFTVHKNVPYALESVDINGIEVAIVLRPSGPVDFSMIFFNGSSRPFRAQASYSVP